MRAHNFQLRIEVQRQEYQACKASRRVSRREALERIVDLIHVARADGPIVHDLAKPVSAWYVRGGDGGLADVVEVWAESADEPF